MYNVFDQAADEQAYSDLLARNQWGRSSGVGTVHKAELKLAVMSDLLTEPLSVDFVEAWGVEQDGKFVRKALPVVSKSRKVQE